uniref:Uncharacterized protein n=1 Tax=Poecilia latipinna TaxID=48699 RepID=A0A3B3TI21_9TELE
MNAEWSPGNLLCFVRLSFKDLANLEISAKVRIYIETAVTGMTACWSTAALCSNERKMKHAQSCVWQKPDTYRVIHVGVSIMLWGCLEKVNGKIEGAKCRC